MKEDDYVIDVEQININGKQVDLPIMRGVKNFLVLQAQRCWFEKLDSVLIICGDEGVGKSTLAQQIGAYFTHIINSWGGKNTFGLDNIHFRLKPYLDTAEKHTHQKGWVNILDEGRKVANRNKSTTSANIEFMNYFSECRHDAHLHIICVPQHHDLDKYIARHRALFVFRVLLKQLVVPISKRHPSGIEFHRGDFNIFFNDQEMIDLHEKGQYVYPAIKRALFKNAHFDDIEIVNDKAYQDKKRYWRKKETDDDDEKPKTKREQGVTNKLIKAIGVLENKGLKQKDIASLIGCTPSLVNKYSAQYAMLRDEKDEKLKE